MNRNKKAKQFEFPPFQAVAPEVPSIRDFFDLADRADSIWEIAMEGDSSRPSQMFGPYELAFDESAQKLTIMRDERIAARAGSSFSAIELAKDAQGLWNIGWYQGFPSSTAYDQKAAPIDRFTVVCAPHAPGRHEIVKAHPDGTATDEVLRSLDWKQISRRNLLGLTRNLNEVLLNVDRQSSQYETAQQLAGHSVVSHEIPQP